MSDADTLPAPPDQPPLPRIWLVWYRGADEPWQVSVHKFAEFAEQSAALHRKRGDVGVVVQAVN